MFVLRWAHRRHFGLGEQRRRVLAAVSARAHGHALLLASPQGGPSAAQMAVAPISKQGYEP